MNWITVSVIANIVLGVLIAVLALDRWYWRRLCALRHNPIDEAIEHTKKNISLIFEKIDDLSKFVYSKLGGDGKG